MAKATKYRKTLEVVPPYVRGYKGVSMLFGVSSTTAWRYISGWLAPAVIRRGGVMLVNTKKALELFNEKGQ